MPLLCCDGCDTIEGRCGGGVKDLRPRFTHTDIRAGQRHLDDRHASLRCRHWERSREGIHRRRVASTGPGPTASSSPPRLPAASRTAANAEGYIPRGRVRAAAAGGIRRRRGQQTRPPTRNTSPAGRKCPRTRRMSPHASELSETRRTLVVPNAARLPLSRWHRRPRMATDSTTTADTTFIRAALRAIVTIGDS